jgi:hypothetical protein
MGHHKDIIDRACYACRATGLYVGIAERDGAAVVCYRCKGSGCERVITEWDDFEGRQSRPEVTRVYQVNPGIVIGVGKGREFDLEDFGGMPADDWRDGKPFPPGSENRNWTCPAWWYQSADYEKKPNWDECGFGAFSSCKHFPEKSKCWARWDAEHVTPSNVGRAQQDGGAGTPHGESKP